jgi:hypothetical protein
VIGWWFTPVSSTNKINRHDIIEILLKVVLNTINLNQPSIINKIFNINMDSEVYLFLTIYYSFADCHLYCATVDGMQCFWTFLLLLKKNSLLCCCDEAFEFSL